MSTEKMYFLYNLRSQVRSEGLNLQELILTLDKEDLSQWFFWMDGMSDWQAADQNETLKTLLPKKRAPEPPPVPNFPPPAPIVPVAAVTSVKPVVTITPEPEVHAFIIPHEVPAPILTPLVETIAEPAKEVQPEQQVVAKEEPLQVLETVPSSLPEIEKSSAAETGKPENRRRYPRVHLKLRAVITNKVKAFITFTENVSLGGLLVTHTIPDEILKGECEIFLFNQESHSGINFKCSPIVEDSNKNRFSFTISEPNYLNTLKTWIEKQEADQKKQSAS